MMKQGTGPVLLRARIWAWAPEELKIRAWPKLKDSLTAQALDGGLDPARAFPKPKGYEDGKVEDKNDSRIDTDDNTPATDGAGGTGPQS
jgi:hypothetical protein